MDEEAETKATERWLRMVDKPLGSKEGGNKDTESRGERGYRIILFYQKCGDLSNVIV